jgi:hypothetical protein
MGEELDRHLARQPWKPNRPARRASPPGLGAAPRIGAVSTTPHRRSTLHGLDGAWLAGRIEESPILLDVTDGMPKFERPRPAPPTSSPFSSSARPMAPASSRSPERHHRPGPARPRPSTGGRPSAPASPWATGSSSPPSTSGPDRRTRRLQRPGAVDPRAGAGAGRPGRGLRPSPPLFHPAILAADVILEPLPAPANPSAPAADSPC